MPETNEFKDFAMAKLAALEKLVELLYVEHFEQFDKPIKAADDFAEALRDTETIQENVPVNLSLQMAENVNSLFDNVISNLRQRGHQE